MLELIKKRRSIRSYTDEPVSDADVKALLVPVGHPAESKPPHTKYDEGKIHYDGY